MDMPHNLAHRLFAAKIGNAKGGFLLRGVPPVIHFNGIFPYKPSSYWGTPLYGDPPNDLDLHQLNMMLWIEGCRILRNDRKNMCFFVCNWRFYVILSLQYTLGWYVLVNVHLPRSDFFASIAWNNINLLLVIFCLSGPWFQCTHTRWCPSSLAKLVYKSYNSGLWYLLL